MKRLAVLVFFSLTISTSQAQGENCPQVDITESFNKEFTFCNVNRFSSSIYVKGNSAEQLMNVLFKDKKKNGYSHRLKNVMVPNIQSSITIKVIEGIHGYNESDNSSYFNIYKNKSDKKERLDNIKSTQKEGIILYFKIDGSDVISRENLEYVLTYLKGMIL